MSDPLGCRMRGGVIYPMPPYGDVGEAEAVVALHPYLCCHDCGEPLYMGVTSTGATVFACRECNALVDVRRVA